ncbi:MAG: hypothetical protein GY832_39040, partial [Chloroflexi bacterium]|nr:hypothetical protein [Chloroflexota bacterium]
LFKLQGFTPPGVMSWFIVLTHPYTTGVHWREGVRLEYEGHQAEVVLNPSTHELWLRARGPSPFNFFNILHHTISERVLGFYKGLKYDRLVPCNCHLDQDADTEPCTYLHDYERLAERMEHNKLEVECDRPPFKQVSVPVLLYGIHYTTNDQIVARLDEIHRDVKQGNEGIQDLHIELSQVSELLQRDFTRTWNYHSASLEAECPNTFVLMPGDRKALAPQALLSTGYTLYLMCQHPGGPHIVKGQKGYPVLQSKDWWAKLAPWLNRLTDYLRYIPKARALAEAYDEGIFNDIKTSLDVFQAILKNVPEEFETHDHPKHLSSAGSRFETMEATGPALRLIHSFLKESDPKEHWCGLHKTITRDGNILWLCDEHRKIHQE